MTNAISSTSSAYQAAIEALKNIGISNPSEEEIQAQAANSGLFTSASDGTEGQDTITVESGDSVWKIAKKTLETLGTEANSEEISNLMNQILAANDMTTSDTIYAGDELKMPEGILDGAIENLTASGDNETANSLQGILDKACNNETLTQEDLVLLQSTISASEFYSFVTAYTLIGMMNGNSDIMALMSGMLADFDTTNTLTSNDLTNEDDSEDKNLEKMAASASDALSEQNGITLDGFLNEFSEQYGIEVGDSSAKALGLFSDLDADSNTRLIGEEQDGVTEAYEELSAYFEAIKEGNATPQE